MGDQSRLIAVPLQLVEANEAVAAWHRHHVPVRGHLFSIGCADGGGCSVAPSSLRAR